MQAQEVSVNGWIFRWFIERVEEVDKAQVNDFVPQLIEDFKADDEMVDAFLEEALYPYAAQALRKVMAGGRGGRPRRPVIENNDGTIQTRDSLEQDAKEHPVDFSAFWVHAESAGYIRLPKMNKSQLLMSIDQDSKRIKTERSRLLFRMNIAEKLPDDDSLVVEDVLSNAELQDLYDEAEQTIEQTEGV